MWSVYICPDHGATQKKGSKQDVITCPRVRCSRPCPRRLSQESGPILREGRIKMPRRATKLPLRVTKERP